MLDPAGPQLLQGTKKVNCDMINVKHKSEFIVGCEQVPLEDSVQVHKAADTFEKELQITSTSNNEEEIDLMNFDDDCLSFDLNNNHVNNTHNVQVSMIDQLLCDLNFGLTTKDELKDSNGNKITQNEQTTSKLSKQETVKEEIPSKDNNNKSADVFTYQVSPNSSPSYVELADGIQPTATARNCTMNETQTTVNGSFRIRPVNGTQVTPRLHTMKETQSDIIFPTMEMTRQKPIGKPKRRKIYSFVELLIYQFSPITKELHNDVKERFSHYVVDYDLLKDNPNNQPRRPGVLRGTIYHQRYEWNGWNGQSSDARERPLGYRNDRAATSIVRKHFESPSELSFLKECVVAQNRWTALLHERELRTSCVREIKDCKSMKWINAHMNFTDKHSENCLAFHMTNDQKSKGKDVCSGEKKDDCYEY